MYNVQRARSDKVVELTKFRPIQSIVRNCNSLSVGLSICSSIAIAGYFVGSVISPSSYQIYSNAPAQQRSSSPSSTMMIRHDQLTIPIGDVQVVNHFPRIDYFGGFPFFMQINHSAATSQDKRRQQKCLEETKFTAGNNSQVLGPNLGCLKIDF